MDPHLEYLVTDRFLSTIVDAQAVRSALQLGVVDRLLNEQFVTIESLAADLRLDQTGLQILLSLLTAAHVVEVDRGQFRLTSSFLVALKYRDLLQAKIDFANLVTPDLLNHFTTLLSDPGQFMRQSRTLELFDYSRCLTLTPENREATRRWTRLTTALTRHEARVALANHDFSAYRRILDIGGNTGEFALQVCKAHPQIAATVVDLPVVCDIGREHVAREPEASRITFRAGDALRDDLPGGFDLVTFKSMLHDWPESAARRLIANATRSLAPGGTLLIFERGPIEIGPNPVPFSMIPMLLFFRAFHSPRPYQEQLAALGYRNIQVRRIDLDTPFSLVTATKSA